MGHHVTHLEIQELLGAYAIHAVDAEERRGVETHLSECPSCRTEVSEHLETAALLSAGAVRAPAFGWERIAAALEDSPPQLDLRRVTRRSVSLKVASAIAICAAIVIGFLALKVAQQDRRMDQMSAALADESLMRSALAVAAHPEAERLLLLSPDQTRTADVVFLPDGTGYIVRHNLKPLPTDRTYQMWALEGDRAVSIGVIGYRPGVVAFRFSGEIEGFAITNEVAGGVNVTGNAPVVSGFRKS